MFVFRKSLPLFAVSPLSRLERWVADFSRRQQFLVACLCGAATTLSLPPFFFLPVLLVTFPILIWQMESVETRRDAFALGWCFGFGYFCAGLYWIAHALLIDAARFGWAIPFAVGGLSALLALYVGFTTWATCALRVRGLAQIFVFSALWCVGEIMRGWILTGFPWNPLGSVWTTFLPVFQSVAWIGIHGLSLLTVCAACMLALWGRWGSKGCVAVTFAVLVGLSLIGAWRVPADKAPVVADVRLRLVQPSIPQTLKWDTAQRQNHVQRYIALSQDAWNESEISPTHVIWGESAVPWAIDGHRDHDLRALLAEIPRRALSTGAKTSVLITGGDRMTPPGVRPVQFWNSVLSIDHTGQVHEPFDKAHLVPFGEYVPLRSILPVDKVTPGAIDYSVGSGRRTVQWPGLPPVSPLVCYEVIFSGRAHALDNRPDWILNVTNDGWYGVSTGPYQHFATAVARAVEEGLPLVRVANNGISAVIDPWGRITASLGLNEVGFRDADLPLPLEPTFYSQWSQRVPVWLSIFFLLVALAIRSLPLGLWIRPE